MEEIKFLPIYEKWMANGEIMSDEGLCLALAKELGNTDSDDFFEHPLFDIMKPEDDSAFSYWAHNGENQYSLNPHIFNELRQNIVLFMAAMNNEL